MAFVLDASIAVAWVVGKQATPYSSRVRRLAKREAIHVPAGLWRMEVLNAIRQLERRGNISPRAADTTVELLGSLVVTEHAGQRSFQDLFDLARRYDLSSYDACYLALAQDLRLPLACKDGALKQALRNAGVRVA